MEESQKFIRIEKNIKAPVQQVFFALTNATKLRQWLCDTAIFGARVGGRVYFAWDNRYFAAGTILELIPNKKIVYSWYGKDEPNPTLVTIHISSENGHTKLVLEHSGLDNSTAWLSPTQSIEKGWQVGFENLISNLEYGIDLRISQRPIIGIFPGEFIQANSDDSIPIKNGMKVIDVVKDYSAEKAGLKSGDIIFKLNDDEIKDWKSWIDAINKFKAGDQIKIAYYRGMERQDKDLILSAMILPEVPETPKDLAENIKNLLFEMYDRLIMLLGDLSEEEADYSPAPDEWSIKEIIAHFIHTEREHQNWITNLALSQLPIPSDLSENLTSQVKATVALYPSIAELLELLRKSIEESVLCYEFLPKNVVEDKSMFWNLAFMGNALPLHTQSHFKQINNNLKLVRNQKN
ncbi:MAG: SRPBCC domain-containing protein [Anaerolineaceae bacterium]|nr:SRPBCC domain-containing protein [Anaerolineaceae bacterium]